MIEIAFVLLLVIICGIVWLKFRKRPPMSLEDQIEEAMVLECWRTGKTLMGTVDHDGKLTIAVCEDYDDQKDETR
jgi:hypothetical protein